MELKQLQTEAAEWRGHNFPDYTAEDQLLGMVEEMGELAHAFLKNKQQIRGDEAEHLAAMMDALGDWVIYATGFATALDLDLEVCVELAWEQVRQRDWVLNPQDGT